MGIMANSISLCFDLKKWLKDLWHIEELKPEDSMCYWIKKQIVVLSNYTCISSFTVQNFSIDNLFNIYINYGMICECGGVGLYMNLLDIFSYIVKLQMGHNRVPG